MTDFTGRTKLITVHLPIDFGLFNNILRALADTMGDAPFGSVQETTPGSIIFYEPERDQ